MHATTIKVSQRKARMATVHRQIESLRLAIVGVLMKISLPIRPARFGLLGVREGARGDLKEAGSRR